MSNCITIEMKRRIDFRPHEIDSNGLNELIKTANEIVSRENCVKWEDDIDPKYKIAWWFLSGNVEFRKGGGVTIWLGESRSTHTNRDFNATLNTLKEFVKVDKWHNFGISDEYDNHETIFRVAVNLKTGERR